jgi:endoribonuclease Dicer
VSSSCLEVGVDSVRCNLVVDLDAPTGYYEYSYHKVKAKAPVAKAGVNSAGSRHLVFCAEGETAPLIERLAFYDVVEQRLKRSGEKEEEEEQVEKLYSRLALETDDSKMEEGKEGDEQPKSKKHSATIETSVGLVNRYCAKLPSDTFTRLTPIYTSSKTSNGLFLCAIHLPINRFVILKQYSKQHFIFLVSFSVL